MSTTTVTLLRMRAEGYSIVDFCLNSVHTPQVTVSRVTEGEIEIGSRQTLNCSATIEKLDVPVTITLQWRLHSLVLNESIVSGHLRNHDLSLVLDSYNYNTSSSYVCTVYVHTTVNSTAIAERAIVLRATNGRSIHHNLNFILFSIHQFSMLAFKWITVLHLTSLSQVLPTIVQPAL